MEIVATIFHVLICVLLIVAVLLQSGKGGGLAGSIGGGMSSSSIVGGRSATTFLTKATAVLAATFMLFCLVQSFSYTAPVVDDSTATERMLERGGSPGLPPTFTDGFLEEEPSSISREAATEPTAEDAGEEDLLPGER